jgi:flagellar assembly protein FliH
MSTRLDLARVSVLPFQYPQLKNHATEPANVQAPAPVDIDSFGEMPPETGAAEDTVDAAEEQAAAIAAELARGHAEGFEQGLAEGREQGYAAGFAEGVTVGETSLTDQARRLASIIFRLGEPIAALEEPVEEAVAALALEVARCVIGDEVNRSREFLAGLVREAIAKVPIEMGAPRVLLNPADLELIRRLVPEIDAGSATLVADDTVEAGGCLVVADGDEGPVKDRRWNARTAEGVSQVNLTLPSRWRAVMLTLFDGENE